MDAWKEQGITFVEESPGPDVLGREDALQALKGCIAPDAIVQPSAIRFGRMSAKMPAIGRLGEAPVPVVWGRLVWVITVQDQALPRGGRHGFSPPKPVRRQIHHVLDGVTGERLFAFSP